MTTTPTLTDLVRHALAALLATLCLPEAAEQLRDATLRWPTAAELLAAWAYQPTLDDRTPGRLRAAQRAAEAMGRDDVAEAVTELATREGLTPGAWEALARDRWVALMCEACGETWPSASAAEHAGCLAVAPGWVLCPDCRSEPDPTPPAPAPTRRPRPALARCEGTAAALVEGVQAVSSPAAAVAWWIERAATLEALPTAERTAVRTALARRVMEVGGGGTRSLPAARNYLTREIAAASVPSTPAATTPPVEAPALALVPAPVDLDPEVVLARFAAKVAEVTLPSEGGALWIAQRHALAALPRGQAETAFHALCEHLETTGHLGRAKFWLKKYVAEHDAHHAAAALLAGAA